jgi:hypothetical protein
VDGKPDDEICLFVRDEQTRRFLFNVKALQALGINATKAQQHGYAIEEPSPLADFSWRSLARAAMPRGTPTIMRMKKKTTRMTTASRLLSENQTKISHAGYVCCPSGARRDSFFHSGFCVGGSAAPGPMMQPRG